MNKRFIGLMLLIAGISVLAIVLYFVLLPLIKKQPTTPAVPTSTGQPTTTPTTPQNAPTTPAPTPAPGSPADNERQAEEAIKRQSIDVAARAFSYSNADGFAGITSVFTESTADLKAFLESERARLVTQHPLTTSWRQTARTVSARIVSPLPLLGKTYAQVSVQAQMIVDEAGKAQIVSYQEITISYVKQGNLWVAARMETQPFEP